MKDIAFYLGREKEEGFTGFIAEENFFLILTVDSGFDSEKGHEALKSIKEEVLLTPPGSLAHFEGYIGELVKKNNIPINFSLATAYLKDKVLYLKTAGLGEIFIYRGNKLGKIIQGEISASGKIEEGDLFIFTTENFRQTAGSEEELKKIFTNKRPHEIVDEITPGLKSKDDRGLICLFVKFVSPETLAANESGNAATEEASMLLRFSELKKKKGLTFAAVFIIFLILLWSVGFGYQRRSLSYIQKKISASSDLINQDLSQASEVAFLNLPRALSYIADAKNEVNKLKKDVGDRKEVQQLEKLISNKENSILKKEEKSAEEFYDLAIDNKAAKGDDIYLTDDAASILDTTQGVIYQLSLTKKSIDKKSFPEIKSAKKIASYKDDIIFFKDDGFYKISSGKMGKTIDKDSDWGNIKDIWIYNGNIYALDSGRDEIYKYLAGDENYSSKSGYFKPGQGIHLADANSLAIDSSLYIGFSDFVAKFTAGERDGFKTSFPENVKLNKIFTSKDVEKVYAWDKTKGAIYILSKDGEYEREINSPILKSASDFVAFGTNAYVLAGSKIYKISLD